MLKRLCEKDRMSTLLFLQASLFQDRLKQFLAYQLLQLHQPGAGHG